MKNTNPKPPQWKALKTQLDYLDAHSPFYQNLFSKNSISVKTLSAEGFLQIPITKKEDLAKHNSDFLCVPKSEIIDYVTTSGTLAEPVTVALNEPDLQRLAKNEEQSFRLTGLTKNDIVQITTTLDRRFMAGMAYFLGLRKLGAGIVRVGSGLPELQWDSIDRFQPTYLVAVPSFLLKLTEYAESQGINPNQSSVKAAVCIGEPLRDENFKLNTLGKKITEKWDIELFSTYASTEMATAFTECKFHQGQHIQEDLIYTEILDENHNPVQNGEVGELVVTMLGVKTMPLLRFATGDLVKKIEERCACGKKGERLSAIFGRKQQLIKYKGTTIYPQQIKDVMAGFGALKLYAIRVKTNELGTDEVEIMIDDNTPAELQQNLKSALKAKLRVIPKLVLWPKDKLKKVVHNPKNRKPVWFLDER